MTLYRAFVLLFSSLWLTTAVIASPEPGKKAPDFIATTSNGKTITLSQFIGKPVVLEWTNHQCPYVVKHYRSGNMQKTQRKATEEGAIWISIISSAPGLQGHVSAEKANELTARRGSYASYIVLDPEGTIGRQYEARTTPHMFLINAQGTIEYMGAIDDKPSSRLETVDTATNYLLQAWEQHHAGQDVTRPSTKPYGCSVKYSD